MCKVPSLMEEDFDSELEVQLVLPAKDDAIAWSECWPHIVALKGCTIQPCKIKLHFLAMATLYVCVSPCSSFPSTWKFTIRSHMTKSHDET